MDTLLGIASIFVQPDWSTLLALFPVFLALLFIAWLAWTFRKFATLGPNRRAPARIQPITPAHVHMPGGSAAPILAAFGSGALFLALVVPAIAPDWGAPALLLGVTLLVATLLYWLREGMRDYAHLDGEGEAAVAARRLPAVVHQGPPPGVHMPGPSIRPLMGALGSAALLGGLVVGGWVLILAVVFLTYTLIGWLVDFTAEYRKVEEADRTGHLENIPDRAIPARALQVFAVLFALVGMWQLGIFPPATAGGGGTPGASGEPSGPSLPPGALLVVAKNIAFDPLELTVQADQPFTIVLRNEDAPTVPHDIDIRTGEGGDVLQEKPNTEGGTSSTYEYTPLAAGTYQFFCSVHPIPAMTGTLTVE
jgi:plastocyanin